MTVNKVTNEDLMNLLLELKQRCEVLEKGMEILMTPSSKNSYYRFLLLSRPYKRVNEKTLECIKQISKYEQKSVL